MTDKSIKKQKKCRKNMFIYGFIQLGATTVSAISLLSIALALCALTKESKIFNACVEEARVTNNSISSAVHFCNGGN